MLTPEHSLAVLEEAPIGVLVIAASGRIEWLNAALARWLELPAERLIGLAGEALPAPHLQALVQLPEQLHVPRVADTPLQLHCHATTLGPLRVGYFSDVTARLLGPIQTDGAAMRPVGVVPRNRWQAARSTGSYSLVGCSVGPGFDFADFELLTQRPDLVERLTNARPDLARFL